MIPQCIISVKGSGQSQPNSKLIMLGLIWLVLIRLCLTIWLSKLGVGGSFYNFNRGGVSLKIT